MREGLLQLGGLERVVLLSSQQLVVKRCLPHFLYKMQYDICLLVVCNIGSCCSVRPLLSRNVQHQRQATAGNHGSSLGQEEQHCGRACPNGQQGH